MNSLMPVVNNDLLLQINTAAHIEAYKWLNWAATKKDEKFIDTHVQISVYFKTTLING